jgi:hypothetical protein
VVGLKDVLTGKLDIFPAADARLNSSQLLLVVGKQAELKQLRELA